MRIADAKELPKGLPECPKGFDKRVWLDRQMWLLWEVKMPATHVRTIKTGRQMNLYAWLLSLGHPWKWIADNEVELIDPKFKRKPGQA